MADNEDDQSNDYEDEEVTEDDEATLDEEDALNDGIDYENELKQLHEENEMSLEELRQKYCATNNEDKDNNDGKFYNPDPGVDGQPNKEDNYEEPDIQPSSSTTRNLRGKVINVIQTACESSTQYFKPEDLEEDDSDEYMPPDIWKKEVRVGSDYQVANVPEFVHTSNTITNISTENEISEVLWLASPERCQEQDVINYLMECEQLRAGEKLKNGRAKRLAKTSLSPMSSTSAIVPDDENALLALYQANYDVNKAKAKAPFEWPALCSANGPRLTQPHGPWRTWTEQDCIDFECGMLEHGKQFWKIKRDFLQSRMIGEIVCFYYSWKKSERYDMWMAKKYRREQQMDPKTTDLMGHIVHSILHEDIQIQQDQSVRAEKIAIDVNETATAETTTNRTDQTVE